MTIFQVGYSEVVFGTAYIEADTEEEAKKVVYDGKVEITYDDGTDFVIDEIFPVSEDARIFLTPLINID
jgi:hypothetical protein